MINMKTLKLILLVPLLMALFNACKQDDYYQDGGKAEAKFDGDIMQYLDSKPGPFDTIAHIIRLAGLEETFRSDEITFFAPSDEYIKTTIGAVHKGGLNDYLDYLKKDTIKTLEDVDPAIWRKYLMRYIFKGANKLKDYPQIDYEQKAMFPGQLYYSYDKSLCNIGVIFNPANGVDYIGYRQLAISYIPDPSQPDDNWKEVLISSSDIQPNNGIVHTLQYGTGQFGFIADEFISDVVNTRK